MKKTDKDPDNMHNDFFRHLCSCANFAIVATNHQGIIISWNKAAGAIFGTDAQKMLGSHIESIVPDSYREVMRQAVERTIAHKQVSEFEINNHQTEADSENTQTLLITVNPVIDDNDKALGAAVWILDISKRKNLQQQLVQAEKMASLGTLASGIAHHFNNIIGGVATFVDYALTSDSVQAGRRAMEMTAEASRRISQITSSLLTFAEKDMRQFDLSDLTEVVITFGHLVEKPLAKNNITLELRIQAVPVCEVPGSRIHQVLGNLLDNAEHAMPQGGSIIISMHRQDKYLVMIFSDTGCGIEGDNLTHIFDPFFTTRGLIAGGDHAASSGLGLSVVHGIISELGGKINVTSELGKGTTFTICLPLTEKHND